MREHSIATTGGADAGRNERAGHRRTCALLVAAGRGKRLGRAENKAFVTLCGRPLVWYSLEALRACPEITDIVVVVAPEDVERARGLLASGDRARALQESERVVAGGAERMASVRAGLAEVDPSCDTVLVHDGARPFLSSELIRRCLSAVAEHAAVVAALPATDTVKQVGEQGVVAATLDRSRLWLAQTPQVFRRTLLMEAHERAMQEGARGTDDASLVERLGRPVHVVLGDPANIKITTAEDLARAEAIVAGTAQLQPGDTGERRTGGREAQVRCGIGYDAHRFTGRRELVLGGVRFEGEPGLLGHSDADVLCHAICDALLGAAAAGDIGRHFPDRDPRYAGISSLSLLTRVAALVRGLGWEIGNVDAVVVAEAPRLSDRVPEMCRALARAMGLGEGQVSVKGKTSEGMGFAGRREGIAAQAVCMLVRRRGSHRSRERAV